MPTGEPSQLGDVLFIIPCSYYVPCKKCDMDSHRNTSPCHFMSQIHCSLVQINIKFQDYSCHLSRIYLFSMQKHDMDFGQVQVMEFPWRLLPKWWDFHRIWSHFQPNCRQKDMRKSVIHFLQGKFIFSSQIFTLCTRKVWKTSCVQIM